MPFRRFLAAFFAGIGLLAAPAVASLAPEGCPEKLHGVYPFLDGAEAVALDPAGLAFAVGRKRIVNVYPLPFALPGTFAILPTGIRALAYTADGRTLAAGDQVGAVHLLAQREGGYGHVVSPLGNDRRPIGALAFSSDGTRLAVGFADGTFVVWNLEEGRVAYRGKQDDAALVGIAFRKSDDALLTLSAQGIAHYMDIRNPRVRKEFRRIDTGIRSLDGNPWIAHRELSRLLERASPPWPRP